MSERDIWERLTAILSGTVEALEDSCNPVSSYAVEISEPGNDYCCDSGYAYIRPIRVGPVNPFPQQFVEPTKCPEMGALVELGIMRCSPTMDSAGNSPHLTEITDVSDVVVKDMRIMYNYLSGLSDEYTIAYEGWEEIEDMAGCVGGFWRFWVDVDLCSVDCEESP